MQCGANRLGFITLRMGKIDRTRRRNCARSGTGGRQGRDYVRCVCCLFGIGIKSDTKSSCSSCALDIVELIVSQPEPINFDFAARAWSFFQSAEPEGRTRADSRVNIPGVKLTPVRHIESVRL